MVPEFPDFFGQTIIVLRARGLEQAAVALSDKGYEVEDDIREAIHNHQNRYAHVLAVGVPQIISDNVNAAHLMCSASSLRLQAASWRTNVKTCSRC